MVTYEVLEKVKCKYLFWIFNLLIYFYFLRTVLWLIDTVLHTLFKALSKKADDSF